MPLDLDAEAAFRHVNRDGSGFLKFAEFAQWAIAAKLLDCIRDAVADVEDALSAGQSCTPSMHECSLVFVHFRASTRPSKKRGRLQERKQIADERLWRTQRARRRASSFGRRQTRAGRGSRENEQRRWRRKM